MSTPMKKKRPASGTQKAGAASAPVRDHPWTFLTNHAHVLLLLARDPDLRMREAAAQVGITERAVQRIVLDLERAEYLVREKEGRRNRYHVRSNRPLRHPIEAHRSVAALIGLLKERGS